MILSDLNRLLVNIANSNFLVHQAFVGDVYTINAKENRFGCFVATPMSAIKPNIGSIRYNYVLYYIDRLTKDEANIDFIQTDAVNLLKGVLGFLGENGVEIEGNYEFTLFRQKFDDWCAGAYVSVNILVPDNDCSEGIFNTGGVDLRPLVVDRNGIYEPGSFDGYNQVTVDVPQQGATEEWVDQEIDFKLIGYATESWVTSQGYLSTIDLSEYATQSWVTSQGYLTSVVLDGYATQSWVSNQGYLTSVVLDGYATQVWVQAQGYITSETIPADIATQSWVINQGYITVSGLTDYATKSWVSNQGYLTSIPDLYATKSWVSGQGYLTSIPSEYATKNWVSSQGYITVGDLTGYATESWVNTRGFLTSVPSDYATKSWVSNQGYLVSTDLTGYATQSWVTSQGYLTSVPSEYATQSWVISQQFATETYVGSQITQIQSWITSQNYLSSADLTGYAKESWCTSQFFEESKIWTGTSAQWDSLTPSQQAVYTIALITE